MKRRGNIYDLVCSVENLHLADGRARRHKLHQESIKMHDRNREDNIAKLHAELTNGRYSTSPYHIFTIREPKERVIYRLPYYPDRIVHHAIMNVLEPILVPMFTADTYSCIKGRGVHLAAERVRKALCDRDGTQYCLKLDIRKFYPSIDHEVLKGLLRRKLKDAALLELLDEIIDSAEGLPIGNYLSQYLANFYMTGFDHWIKEVKGVRYYFRYADDIVVLGSDKAVLHGLLADIREYLGERLKLEVKGNYQVFPVAARGIDFVGYVFYHTHTRVRKRIKQAFARKLRRRGVSASTTAAYYGWLKHCNSKNLIKKLSGENIQGPRHKGGAEWLEGGENKGRKDIERADRGARAQDRTIEALYGEELCLSTDKAQRGGPCGVYGGQENRGGAGHDEGRGLSVHDDNCKGK